mmetsp:Transcript_32275/g.77072  ORF Transcript_32275/g.77072 Transcript_32275/m.77072 type:complete len:393 (+) Transcript_32275:596-1774(+)
MRLLDHAAGSDVVCMAVRVDHIFDRESQLLGQSQVAALHAQHRIDENGGMALGAANEVSEGGAALCAKELLDHEARGFPLGGGLLIGGRQLLHNPVPHRPALGAAGEGLQVQVLGQQRRRGPGLLQSLGLRKQQHRAGTGARGALHHQRPRKIVHSSENCLGMLFGCGCFAGRRDGHHLHLAASALNRLLVELVTLRVEVQPALVAGRQLRHRGGVQVACKAHIPWEERRGDPEELRLYALGRGGRGMASTCIANSHIGFERCMLRRRSLGRARSRLGLLVLGRGLEGPVLAIPPTQRHPMPVAALEHPALQKIEESVSLLLVHHRKGGSSLHSVSVELRQHELTIAQQHRAGSVPIVGGVHWLVLHQRLHIVNHHRSLRRDGRIGLGGRQG